MKNAIEYRLRTKYGGWYETDSRGYVVRCDNGLDKSEASLHDLMSWQIMGIVEVRPFGNVGPLIRLDDALKIQTFRFKNGKPRFTIVDIDHGTQRVHGNTPVHGIVSVEKVTN